jgi:hypothetical protein
MNMPSTRNAINPHRASRILAVAGSAVALTGIALMTLSWGQLVTIDQLTRDSQSDPELDAALVAVLDSPACPKDPAEVPQFVEEAFPFMFPELALREKRKNPAFVQAEAAANALMANPSAIRDELMKDPDFPAREQAVANQIVQWNSLTAGLQQQVLEEEVAAWEAQHRPTPGN